MRITIPKEFKHFDFDKFQKHFNKLQSYDEKSKLLDEAVKFAENFIIAYPLHKVITYQSKYNGAFIDVIAKNGMEIVFNTLQNINTTFLKRLPELRAELHLLQSNNKLTLDKLIDTCISKDSKSNIRALHKFDSELKSRYESELKQSYDKTDFYNWFKKLIKSNKEIGTIQDYYTRN